MIPKRWRRASIRSKLTLLSMTTAGLALALATLLLFSYEIWDHTGSQTMTLRTQGHIVGANAAAAMVAGDPQSAARVLYALRVDPDVRAACLYDRHGRTFADYERTKYKYVWPEPPAEPTVRWTWQDVWVFQPLMVDKDRVGTIALVGEASALRRRLASYAAISALVFLLAALGAALSTAPLRDKIMRPIVTLAEAARRVRREHNYAVRVEGRFDKEFSDLARAFNGMLTWIAIHTDELTRLNRDLTEARDRAEEATRLKSLFLANISHEIRTPMNGILGMTELLLGTQLDREQSEYLGFVKSSATALLAILNDLLDYSKIEAGKFRLEATEFSPCETIGEAVKSLSVQAHEKGLELVCDVDASVPALALGDPLRLRQVLVNLVSNGIKFTKQGEVVVRASATPDGDGALALCVAVSDTGIGVAPEARAFIFGAFQQADGSITRRYGGTGLGLTISSQIVEMMGGQIELESQPGCGSCFKFSIRVQRVAEQPVEAMAEPWAGCRVLIVSGNESHRASLEGLCRRLGMRPTGVPDGLDALGELRVASGSARPYRLVLADAQMRGLDGAETARRIRKEPNLGALRIFLLAPFERQPGGRPRQVAGVDGTLVKPLLQAELAATLSELT